MAVQIFYHSEKHFTILENKTGNTAKQKEIGLATIKQGAPPKSQSRK